VSEMGVFPPCAADSVGEFSNPCHGSSGDSHDTIVRFPREGVVLRAAIANASAISFPYIDPYRRSGSVLRPTAENSVTKWRLASSRRAIRGLPACVHKS